MRQLIYLLAIMAVLFVSCENNLQEELIQEELSKGQPNPTDYLKIINNLGFDASSAVDMGSYYVVEGDIMLKKDELPKYDNNPVTRQAYTNAVISLNNVSNLKIKIDASLNSNSNWRTAILNVMQNYNGLASGIYMYEVSSNPDITISYGSINAWGMGEFPASDGKAGKTISIQNSLTANNLSLLQKTFLVAHEMGHNLGFRHTDYLTPYWNNYYYQDIAEGVGSEGANHVPGTPTGTASNQDPNSVFNSGNFYGGVVIPWNGFSSYDKTAILKLYPPIRMIVPQYVCWGTEEVFSLSYLPAGATVTWTGDNLLQLTSGQGSPNARFASVIYSGLIMNSGFGMVKAKITRQNGEVLTYRTLETWVGEYNLKNLTAMLVQNWDCYYKIHYTGNVPKEKVVWSVQTNVGYNYAYDDIKKLF